MQPQLWHVRLFSRLLWGKLRCPRCPRTWTVSHGLPMAQLQTRIGARRLARSVVCWFGEESLNILQEPLQVRAPLRAGMAGDDLGLHHKSTPTWRHLIASTACPESRGREAGAFFAINALCHCLWDDSATSCLSSCLAQAQIPLPGRQPNALP